MHFCVDNSSQHPKKNDTASPGYGGSIFKNAVCMQPRHQPNSTSHQSMEEKQTVPDFPSLKITAIRGINQSE